MTPELKTACARAVHVVRADGNALRAGRATLYILSHVGWGWFARFLSWPPMIWFVELFYWLVATNRMFFSKFLFTKRD
jgi:predicted DCC family thiol-disulfide oxidoreductase YuxK